jgi:hypothetical protein
METYEEHVNQQISTLMAFTHLVKGVMGAGSFALPWAFTQSGIFLGPCVLFGNILKEHLFKWFIFETIHMKGMCKATNMPALMPGNSSICQDSNAQAILMGMLVYLLIHTLSCARHCFPVWRHAHYARTLQVKESLPPLS